LEKFADWQHGWTILRFGNANGNKGEPALGKWTNRNEKTMVVCAFLCEK